VTEYLLEVRNVTKSFPGVKALKGVSIQIRHGEIHAFVGENGAGKSTLMKILNGNYKKDDGVILFNGKEVDITNPVQARELGISIIFQELNLASLLTVAENIFLGRMIRPGEKTVNWKRIYREAGELLNKIGYYIDPHRIVSTLSIAEKQMVEIAKALSFENTKLILMDEPSATLTNKELETLFTIIRDLKKKGVSVIYISHKLEEIFTLCDWVTVLRDGEITGSKPVFEYDENTIIAPMVGREITNVFPKRESDTLKSDELLRVTNLNRKGVLNNISFTLHKGEVLGIAGLVGAGRTEMSRAIFGVDYRDGGDIYIAGKKVKIDSPEEAIRQGVAYLSEDRKREGLVGINTVKKNLTLANLNSVLKFGLISGKREVIVSHNIIDKLAIKTPSANQIAFNLSGGNQQKTVVGKWLNTEAKIFIFDEPTRGIDVGAKYEIYVLINKLVKEGNGVIMISSELPEVLNMSDRVLIMNRGSISGELTGQDRTAENFIKYAL